MKPSELIDQQIADLPDWRGQMFAHLRQLIHEADPRLIEEWKWGTAVWTYNGLVCAVGAFKDHLKINFFKGSSLADPRGLFNSGLDAKAMRSIDLHKGDSLDEPALKELIGVAIAHNTASRK